MRSLIKLSAALIVCSVLAGAWPQLSITDYSSPAIATPVTIAAGPDGALWFTDFSKAIGRITTTGAITRYLTPTRTSGAWGIVAGPDGAMWFTEFSANQIGRSTTDGVVTEYAIPTAGSGPRIITVGSDGALWFTEQTANKIGRIDTSGAVTEYPIPTASSAPFGIVGGPDGALWFAESNGSKIGRITTAGVFTEYATPTASSRPNNITAGPDGALWFTESTAYKIGRVTTGGSFTEYPLPDSSFIGLSGIAVGSDGALWFTEYSKVGRMTTVGLLTEYPLGSTILDGITTGSDGALWFTKLQIGTISRGVIIPAVGASIYPAGLPPGDVGTPYSAAFSAAEGAPPYSNWTISSGTFPPGLALDPGTGVISGTPTAPGSYPTEPYFNFSVTVQDSTGATSLAQGFSIAINRALQIVAPTSLPVGIVGVTYPPPGRPLGVGFISSGGTITPSSGLPNVFPTWSAVGLPNGLTMNASGLLGGVPAEGSQGTYQPHFTVRDLVNGTATISLPLTISLTEVPPMQITPVTLPPGKQGTTYLQTLAVSGGFLPYNWDIVSGSLPAGESLLSDGRLFGTPTAFGTFAFAVRVTDSLAFTATQSYNLMIAPGLRIESVDPLISGAVAIAYQQFLLASGGTPPYTWSLISGALPPGLSLASNGTIAGTGVSVGTSAFTVRVTDAASLTDTRTFSLTMNPQLAITTTTLPSGNVGVPYGFFLAGIGGYFPYTWTLVSGTLPEGLILYSSTGAIAGVPLTAGTSSFTVRATDGASPPVTQTLSLTITGGPLTITTATLPAGIVGSFYVQNLGASGGKPPYTWSIASGSLPPGLSISGNGTAGAGAVIMGTLTTTGTFNFTVRLTDSAVTSVTQAFSLPVETQVRITTTDPFLPTARLGTFYSQTFAAIGGTPPYSWSMSPASAVPGLSLSTAGMLSGTPTALGTTSLLVTVTDANSLNAGQSFILTVNPPCVYSISSGGQVFPAAGGTGQIVVTAGFGCAWTVSGPPSWVTITNGAGGSGSGVVNYLVASNSNSSPLNATFTVAGFAFAIQTQGLAVPPFVGSMPHLAAEENWTTAFTLVNKGASATTARLSLFGDSAGGLRLPLVLPQQPPAAGPLMAASLDETLWANASLIVETAGAQTSPVRVGSAQLAAAGAVDGFAIFRQIVTAQEAVVPLETRNASSYLLAFDNTNGLVLGVALQNVSAQSALIPVIIRDDSGAVISTPGAGIFLVGSGHKSFVLSDAVNGFPETDNRRGTIEFDTPVGGQISVLGLRFTPPNNALTTIPSLANVGTGGGSIAHLASGGDGWQTTFVLVNSGSSSAPATLSFFDDQTGAPLSLPLAFPQSGGGTTMTTQSYTAQLAAGATLLIISSGTEQLLTGSAQLSTTGNVSGFVIFRHNDQEAVVPLESRNASGYIIAFDNTNGTATGIALNAVSAGQVNIPVTVRDATGAQIATDMITLAANGHYAFTLGTDRYQVAANIRGTIEFNKPVGAQIGVLGIRIPAVAAHTYTTLPALAK